MGLLDDKIKGCTLLLREFDLTGMDLLKVFMLVRMLLNDATLPIGIVLVIINVMLVSRSEVLLLLPRRLKQPKRPQQQ
jgi:hypothetical protein